MTLSDQFLTLVAFPLCFVIQLVTIDEVVSNHLISGDNIISCHAGFAIQRNRAADLQSVSSAWLIARHHQWVLRITNPRLNYAGLQIRRDSGDRDALSLIKVISGDGVISNYLVSSG